MFDIYRTCVLPGRRWKGTDRLHPGLSAPGAWNRYSSASPTPSRALPSAPCRPPAGKVSRIRLLGDYAHSTRIAFVEFHHAEGALAALNCSGALLGKQQGSRAASEPRPGRFVTWQLVTDRVIPLGRPGEHRHTGVHPVWFTSCLLLPITQHPMDLLWCPAGSLPIRVSPSKTPVKVDSSARDGGSSEQGPTSSAASSQSLSHLQPPPQQQQQQGASSQAQQVQREPEQQQEQAESEEQQ